MLRIEQRTLSYFGAIVAVPLLLLALASTTFAWADEIDVSDTDMPDVELSEEATLELDQLQAQIESTANDYDEAVAKVEELTTKIEATQTRIDEINEQLPGRQATAAGALKTLYVLQSEGYDIITLALSSENLTDFLCQIDYIDCIHQHSASEIAKLDALRLELEETQTQLAKDKADADTAAERAERAMEQAKAARQEAQERALAEAQAEMEANEAAMAAAAAAAAEAQAADMSKEEFVSEWSGRLNNYLSGTAMAGQGENYAEAAWKYGVDPRIGAAVSTVESGTGAVNFRSYNAWGWGNYSYSSWDEAIDSWTSGYAKGYSNNVTSEDAAKYCPPNSGEWQRQVINNMESM